MKRRYVHTGARRHLPSSTELLALGYGILILAVVLISYVLGALQWLPFDPQALNLAMINAPPGAAGHWLGTDFLGRDIMTRLVVGIQAYFAPGLLAVVLALTVGTTLGVLAGYYGGRWRSLATYITQLIDALPRLVLILLVVAAFKPDIYYIMAVAGLTGAPAVAAMIQNKIDMLRSRMFIQSAVALGLPDTIVIFKHILWYNCRSLLVVQATLGMGEAILLETSLSYLGFGVQEPTPSWGNMVQSGANYLLQGQYWSSSAPALAIALTVLGFYALGDALSNRFEGRAR